uniref:Uncharacterized protein n=1 Tax=Moniliophthora roreri TaxID=221103 RepID=A0A0W0G5Y3_MONRR
MKSPTGRADKNFQDEKLACHLHEAVIYSLFQVDGHTELSGDAIDLVNNTFGRFTDAYQSSVTISEPWMIASIVRWFQKSWKSVIDVDYLTDKISAPEISSNHINALMAAGLAAVFDREDGRRLGDVFSHPNFQDLEITGEIVFNAVVSGDIQERSLKYSSDFSQRLATWTYNAKETLAWIENRDTPFCIFCTDDKTSTLLFTIKTSNGERFWVFLRMILPLTGNDEVAKDAESCANALLPSNLLRPLHGKRLTASVTDSLQKVSGPESFVGTSGVLRVVGVFAHDAEALDSWSSKVYQVSVLNTESIRSATRRYGTKELPKCVVSHAIVNDSMAKRKTHGGIGEDEESAQPKKRCPTEEIQQIYNKDGVKNAKTKRGRIDDVEAFQARSGIVIIVLRYNKEFRRVKIQKK